MNCSKTPTSAIDTLRVGIYARHLSRQRARELSSLVGRAFPGIGEVCVQSYLDPDSTAFGPPGPGLGRLLGAAARGELDVVLVDDPVQFGVGAKRRHEVMLTLTMERVHVLTPTDLRFIANGFKAA